MTPAETGIRGLLRTAFRRYRAFFDQLTKV
jgi:hypothetical protein